MANNYRHSGKHMPVATASAAIVSGALVFQEGFFGIAITNAALGASCTIDTMGVFVLPVPAGVVKGTKLYGPGAPPAETAAVALTATAAGNTLIGIAAGDRDAAGNALVKLAHQPAA